MQAIFTRSPVGSPVDVWQQLPGQTAKTSELCMWPSGQRARCTRNPDKLPGGPEVRSRSEHWMDLFLSHGRLPVVPHFLTWSEIDYLFIIISVRSL